eukprot:6331244-Amphidinium_carterae.1
MRLKVIVFSHLQKAGGTSVKHALTQLCRDTNRSCFHLTQENGLRALQGNAPSLSHDEFMAAVATQSITELLTAAAV